MTSKKNDDDDDRIEKKAYEPPRLFDLSGGGAYIGAKKGRSGTDCKVGHGATYKCHKGICARNNMHDCDLGPLKSQRGALGAKKK